jgi:hypothetical protein
MEKEGERAAKDLHFVDAAFEAVVELVDRCAIAALTHVDENDCEWNRLAVFSERIHDSVAGDEDGFAIVARSYQDGGSAARLVASAQLLLGKKRTSRGNQLVRLLLKRRVRTILHSSTR